MAFQSGYSDRALAAALDRQTRLEDKVAFQRAGNGDWPVIQPGFDERGLGGQFAKNLSDRRFANDVSFWKKLYSTGQFGADPSAMSTTDSGGMA